MPTQTRQTDSRLQDVTAICVLEKVFPPDQSFIRGMLANAWPSQTGARVICLVGRGEAPRPVQRYGKSICLAVLKERRGINRIWNAFLIIWYVGWLLMFRCRKSNVLFVRDDPVHLLATLCWRLIAKRIVYQNTYPHEDAHHSRLHKILAKTIFYSTFHLLDTILVVAPKATDRIRRYSVSVPVKVVPLLNDNAVVGHPDFSFDRPYERMELLYLGTHAASREMEVVFEACLKSHRHGVPVHLRSVGATEAERKALESMPIVQEAIKIGVVSILLKRPRSELGQFLSVSHVGLSIIPETKIFEESSPTKLGEYFASGLPALASRGIPMQEQWMEESRAGELVHFNVDDISRGIEVMWTRRSQWQELSKQAASFADQKLRYDTFTQILSSAFGYESTSVHTQPIPEYVCKHPG